MYHLISFEFLLKILVKIVYMYRTRNREKVKKRQDKFNLIQIVCCVFTRT